MTGEDEYPDHWEVDDCLRCEIDHLRASYDALVSNSAAEHQRMSDLCEALSTNVTRLDEENVQQRHTIDYLRGQLERRDDDYARLYSQAEDIKEQYRDCASALEAERRHHAAASARVHDLECNVLEYTEYAREQDRVLARLRTMFGVAPNTDTEEVFLTVERYDAHNLRTIDSLRDHLQMQTRLAQLNYLEQQRWQEMAEDLWEELQEWHAPRCPAIDLDAGACTCHRILAAKWDELTHAADYADDGEEA